MANRFSSSGGSSSLRQSLGMPVRGHGAGSGPGRPADKLPWQQMASSGTNNRRKTYVASSTTSTRGTAGLGLSSRPPSQQRKTSVMGASRHSAGRSSIYGSSSGIKKDPRPLSDKAYQNESIKKLIKFLHDAGYRLSSLSTRELQAPTFKQFVLIFNFLLELIDDTLPINGVNMVEDVPAVLKSLGYPFNVSKNHMLNVGSPHSWPILLGAIMWLVDCCSVVDNTSQLLFYKGSGFTDEEEQENPDLIEYEIEELMYTAYMQHGEDSNEYQGILEARERAIREQCEQFETETEVLKQENSQLETEVNELSQSSVPVLQSQVQQNQTDYDELHRHLESDVLQAIKEVQSAMADSDARASECEVQIEASREKVQELEEQIRKQPVSAADARELLQSVKNAEDTLEIKREQQHESAKRISELQMQHNRHVTLINNQCQQINGLLIRVAALLPDLASLSPLDYDTSKRADPEVLQGLIAHAKFLRDEIQKLHRGVVNGIHEYEGKMLAAESAQSALHTELVKKELEVADLQHKLGATKEDLDRRRRLNEENMKSELVEKLALEDNLRALQKRLKTEPVSEREYFTFKAKCESEIVDMEKHLAVDGEELQDLILTLTQFVEALQDHQRGIGKKVEDILKQFKNLKIPTVHPDFLNSAI